MLKRLVRHRIFQVFLFLIIVIGALSAPIRHDYTFDQYPGVACNKDCGYGQQTTEVGYGMPFVWLTLTKTVSAYDHHVVSSKTMKNTKQLAADVASSALLATIIVIITQRSQRRPLENLRH
jgi:hypothetical protein